eukprot:COSAG01_NODE_1035_length_11997_cov_95.509665_10_plen_116_part_00
MMGGLGVAQQQQAATGRFVCHHQHTGQGEATRYDGMLVVAVMVAMPSVHSAPRMADESMCCTNTYSSLLMRQLRRQLLSHCATTISHGPTKSNMCLPSTDRAANKKKGPAGCFRV